MENVHFSPIGATVGGQVTGGTTPVDPSVALPGVNTAAVDNDSLLSTSNSVSASESHYTFASADFHRYQSEVIARLSANSASDSYSADKADSTLHYMSREAVLYYDSVSESERYFLASIGASADNFGSMVVVSEHNVSDFAYGSNLMSACESEANELEASASAYNSRAVASHSEYLSESAYVDLSAYTSAFVESCSAVDSISASDSELAASHNNVWSTVNESWSTLDASEHAFHDSIDASTYNEWSNFASASWSGSDAFGDSWSALYQSHADHLGAVAMSERAVSVSASNSRSASASASASTHNQWVADVSTFTASGSAVDYDYSISASEANLIESYDNFWSMVDASEAAFSASVDSEFAAYMSAYSASESNAAVDSESTAHYNSRANASANAFASKDANASANAFASKDANASANAFSASWYKSAEDDANEYASKIVESVVDSWSFSASWYKSAEDDANEYASKIVESVVDSWSFSKDWPRLEESDSKFDRSYASHASHSDHWNYVESFLESDLAYMSRVDSVFDSLDGLEASNSAYWPGVFSSHYAYFHSGDKLSAASAGSAVAWSWSNFGPASSAGLGSVSGSGNLSRSASELEDSFSARNSAYNASYSNYGSAVDASFDGANSRHEASLSAHDSRREASLDAYESRREASWSAHDSRREASFSANIAASWPIPPFPALSLGPSAEVSLENASYAALYSTQAQSIRDWRSDYSQSDNEVKSQQASDPCGRLAMQACVDKGCRPIAKVLPSGEVACECDCGEESLAFSMVMSVQNDASQWAVEVASNDIHWSVLQSTYDNANESEQDSLDYMVASQSASAEDASIDNLLSVVSQAIVSIDDYRSRMSIDDSIAAVDESYRSQLASEADSLSEVSHNAWIEESMAAVVASDIVDCERLYTCGECGVPMAMPSGSCYCNCGACPPTYENDFGDILPMKYDNMCFPDTGDQANNGPGKYPDIKSPSGNFTNVWGETIKIPTANV